MQRKIEILLFIIFYILTFYFIIKLNNEVLENIDNEQCIVYNIIIPTIASSYIAYLASYIPTLYNLITK